MKIRKFMGDSLLNIIVTIVPLIVLQFIIYPIISRTVSKEEYGIMITIYSFMYLISGTLGSELNRLRLLKEKEYSNRKIKGDFNFIIILEALIVVIFCLLASMYVFKCFNLNSILVAITGIFIYVSSYLQVGFRLELNYKKIAYSQLITLVGYLLGLIAFLISKYWILVFLFGTGCSCIYCIYNTNLLKESWKRTTLFSETFKDNLHLVAAGFFNRVISYGDKILLFPIGGSAMVTIYYVATLFGKIISMGIEPINTVFLSYLVKEDSIRIKTFKLIIIGTLGVCCVGYFICIIISKPLLSWLYPMWAKEAGQLISITTLGICISVMYSIVNSFVLRKCDISWQGIINGVGGIVFFLFSTILLYTNGLVGYCIGINISYFVKLLFTLYIYIYNERKLQVKLN